MNKKKKTDGISTLISTALIGKNLRKGASSTITITLTKSQELEQKTFFTAFAFAFVLPFVGTILS